MLIPILAVEPDPLCISTELWMVVIVALNGGVFTVRPVVGTFELVDNGLEAAVVAEL